jgi:hypothetical protein
MLKPTQRKRKEPNPIDSTSPDALEALGDDFTLPRTSPKRMKSLWESAELLLSESESVSESMSSRTDSSLDRTKGSWKNSFPANSSNESRPKFLFFPISIFSALYLFRLSWTTAPRVAIFLSFSPFLSVPPLNSWYAYFHTHHLGKYFSNGIKL